MKENNQALRRRLISVSHSLSGQRIPDPLKTEAFKVFRVARGKLLDPVMAQGERQTKVVNPKPPRQMNGLRPQAMGQFGGIVHDSPPRMPTKTLNGFHGIRHRQWTDADFWIAQEGEEFHEHKFAKNNPVVVAIGIQNVTSLLMPHSV